MASSALLRQEVLDQLYQILKDPLIHGNRVLLNIINAPKDGLVSVNLIYGMTTQLKPYPIDYVEYCIPRDAKQRFRWSCDFTRVGLKENAQYYETNALGFIEEDLDDIDTSIPQEVRPVIYDNGKFYIDDEHTRSQKSSNERFFEYDKLDMKPIGGISVETIHEIACYNCGKTGHHFRNCPQPRDFNRIKSQTDRLFVNVERDSMEPGRLSQQLKEALGMSEMDEPPYYDRMRYYGYPPGYLSYSNKSNNTEAPSLKVFDGKYIIHTKDESFDEQQESILIHSVEYPGLYASNIDDAQKSIEATSVPITYTAEQTQMLQQQWNEYYYNQYQYQYSYQPMYYTSEPQPPGVVSNEKTSNIQDPPPVSQSENLVKQTDPSLVMNDDDQSVDMDISSEDEG